MPSRPVIVLIMVFWLASTTWLVLREVMPWLEAGAGAHYVIDLTDEVGANAINWTVLLKGEPVGVGLSQVRSHPDRAYELKSEFKFDQLKVGKLVEIKKLTSRYRVTPEGELLAVNTKTKLAGTLGIELEIDGNVKDDLLQMKILINGEQQDLLELRPVALGEQRKVLNPMHLLNRLSGLRAGQRWIIPLLDPTAIGLPGQGVSIPLLQAEVDAADLTWHDKEVACWRIEYREPGKKVTARTWVRRKDGLVLQQDASHQGLDFVLVRNPSR